MTLEVRGGNSEELASVLAGGVALQLRPDLSEQDWVKVGLSLGRAAQGIQWFVGDWLNYGIDHGYVPTDRYQIAVEITNMSDAWLKVCAWVARSFKPEDRRADLSFEHHKRLASLRPGVERTAILQVAAEQGISSRDVFTLAQEVMSPSVVEAELVESGAPLSALEQLANSEAAADIFGESEVAAAPVQRVVPTLPSGVIQLGRHRLIVGDATDPSVYDELFADGGQASTVWTDPPYGVAYEGKTDEALTIQNDAQDDDALLKMLALAFSNADDRLREGSGIYIASGFAHMDKFVQVVDAVGWRFSTELVWVKNRFAMGWGHYHPQHEAIIYAMKGAPVRFYGGRDRTTVFGLANVDGELTFTIPSPAANREHPTMKPPRLIFEHLRNSMQHGEIVLDMFAGSGSTMIAAEQLGASAYMIELDPVYAQVIIDRYHREIEGA